MASHPLVLSDPDLLAEFVRESEFKTFFEKRFATPPDIAALLFRNGELIDSYKGAHFSMGGLVTALKGTVGGSTHIALMLADLKPFQVKLPVKALSRDQIEIVGLATLELQLNPDNPSNILGLMGGVTRNEFPLATAALHPNGRRALSRIDVLERIAPHFSDRVIEAVIGRMDAVDIRGETGVQDKIQADMMKEAERICGDIGVLVRAASVEWAMNEAEREEFARAQIAREQDGLDYQLTLLKREIEREQDATEVRMTAQVDIAKLENTSEDELAHMMLNSEIGLIDARETAIRHQEMKALSYEIEVLGRERAVRMEGDLAEAGHMIDLTKEKARLSKLEHDIAELDAKHFAELKKIGAFTDLELYEREQRLELALAKAAQDQSLENLKGLQGLEHSGKDSDALRTMKLADAETRNELARKKAEEDARVAAMKAAANMTPEQILAINAGLSPDVAQVLVEQARSQAGNDGNSMEVMRDLISGAREHELKLLRTGMAGATGVAHGAGGKSDDGGASAELSTSVDCSQCGRTLKAKSKFCTGCGHQLRT